MTGTQDVRQIAQASKQEFDRKVSAYRRQLLYDNPGLSSHELDRKVAEHRTKLIQQDPRTVEANKLHQAFRTEQEAKERQEREASEARRQAEAERQLAQDRERMKVSWLRNGGTADEFEEAWPEMRKKILTDRAMKDQSTTHYRAQL